MAKDPAVLFYTSDFLSGTSFFTMEERGQYITLLCEQHQLYAIPEEHLIKMCGNLNSVVAKKFIRDDDGTYYNLRMREESIKRKSFCESRRKSIEKRYVRSTHVAHTYIRMENENENRDKDIKALPLKEKKELVKKHYGDNVSMTEEEYNNLLTEHGEENTKTIITMLDDYKGANGKRYRSDYRAIRNWVIDSAKQKKKYKINDPDRWI